MKKNWMLGTKYFTKLGKEIMERGAQESFTSFYKSSTLRWGKLKGTDQFGNKYYENMEDAFGGIKI